MEIFIDTANIEEIKKINELGVISGVTTNPSLIAKEGKDFKEVVKEIASIVDGPISAEPVSLTTDEMVKEALELAKIHPNIVIKVPMTQDGLKACKQLSDQGIKVNVTLVFSVNQALLAALAGAYFVSPFVGRLDDISENGMNLIEDISEMFAIQNIQTRIIAASIRQPLHVSQAALAGCDIATVPYDVIIKMFNHPLTNEGIKKFEADWNNVFSK